MRAVKVPGSFAFLELGTAVGAVVRALKWEQRMWWVRDSNRCFSESSEMGKEVGSEVGTTVGAVVKALKWGQRMW